MNMDQSSILVFEKNAENLSKALAKVGVSAVDAGKALTELAKKLQPIPEVRIPNLITYLYYELHPDWVKYARGRFIRKKDYEKIFK